MAFGLWHSSFPLSDSVIVHPKLPLGFIGHAHGEILVRIQARLLRKGQEICLFLHRRLSAAAPEERWAGMFEPGPQPPLHHGRHLNPFPLLYHVYSSTAFQCWSVTAPYPFIHHYLLPAAFLLPPHPFLFYSHGPHSLPSCTTPCRASSSPTSSRPVHPSLSWFPPHLFSPSVSPPVPSLLHFHYLLKGWMRPDAGNLPLWLHRTCMNDTQACSQYPLALSHDFNHY